MVMGVANAFACYFVTCNSAAKLVINSEEKKYILN